jgi:hypothetical protein
VSLIAFNDKVTVLSTAGHANHRPEEIFAESYTDIKRRSARGHCADQQRICSLGEGSGLFLRLV